MSSVERLFLQMLLWAVAQRSRTNRPGSAGLTGAPGIARTEPGPPGSGEAGAPGLAPVSGRAGEPAGEAAGAYPGDGGNGGAMADFRALFLEAASRYGLDPGLLWAVARAESGLNPRAVSRAGAMGLMQLMPATARALGVTDPFDPAQNLDAGARYLRQQLERFGDIRLALAAYNAGPGAVQQYGGVPPYRETRAYVERVLALWRQGGGGPGPRG